jgi:ABC-type iron transport system FetAB ATPase subunit
MNILDKEINIKKEWYGRAIINSNKRFTYEEAQNSIENDSGLYHKELSIINNISSKYNIIYLDEIDGPLDVDNRRTFLDMLSIQMERLSCEQIFIISHNDVFDSSDAGTILLRNNGNLSLNDNIIFDYRNN